MSFGFSAGDFVAGLNLIKQVFDALSASTGSASDFRALLGTLKSLENAFKICDLIYQQCDVLEPFVRAKADVVRQQLLSAHEQSTVILGAFLSSVGAYTEAFVDQRVGVLRHVRKITWISHKGPVAKLERDLKGHLDALHICASALCHLYLTSNTAALSSTEAKVDTILSNVTELLPKVTTIFTHIQNGNRLVPGLGNPWEGGAAQLDIVILHDAIGRDVTLPIMLLNSPTDLHYILLCMYRGQYMPGQKKILRREYTITDEDNDGIVIEEINWTTIFQPGKHLSLNMILNATPSFDVHRCPICNRVALGKLLPGHRRRCITCQLNFRIYDRERIVEEREMSSVPAALDHGLPDSKLTRVHDNLRRAPLKTDIRIQQPDETRFFKRIHYHRQIPVKRLVVPSEGANEREVCKFGIDSLPPIHRAAATCSIKAMVDLINAGTDVNFRLSFHMQTDRFDFHGASPLLIAAWFGKMKSIEFLLENGANLNALDTGRGGIMEYAICGPCKGRIISRLLTYGADPNIKHYDGCILLHLAAEHGLFWIIDLLVEVGNELDAPWEFGKTPLFFAAFGGHTETVRTLLDLGAATEIRTKHHGWTPLHSACWENHEAIAELLLDYGADIAALSIDQESSLHLAARAGHPDIVRLLLEHGPDISALDIDRESPLHLAARAGHLDIVILLLERGADMQAKNNNGMTPLHVALCNSREETAKSLLSIPGTNCPDEYGYTCLHWAAGAGLGTVVRQILSDGSDIEALPFPPANSSWFGGTALSWASRDGQTEAVKVLLELGANVNTPNPSDQETALHKAARHHHVDIGQLLIEHGANIEHRNIWGNTPLLVAAREGSVLSTTMLLDAGANVCEDDGGWNAWDYAAWNESESLIKVLLQHKPGLVNMRRDHWTALHCAALKGYQSHAKMLLEHGCDIEAKDHMGRTAFYLAVLNNPKNQLLGLLLKHGCILSLQDAAGMAPWDYKEVTIPPADVLDLFTSFGWDLNKPYYLGRTILHTAIIDGNEDVLNYLLSHGCELSLYDKDGFAPWDRVGRPLPTQNVFNLLKAHGWNIDEPYGKGYTTFHSAVHAGDDETVKYLISLGCSVDTTADDGCTPIDIAIKNGNAKIQAMIREALAAEEPSALNTPTGAVLDQT